MKICFSTIVVRTAVLLPLLLPLMFGCEYPQGPNTPHCERPKVVAFTASWCGPCKRDKSVLVQVESWGVDVQVVDVDANFELAAKYNVTSVPTYFIYVCGRSVQRTQDVTVVVAVMKPLFGR